MSYALAVHGGAWNIPDAWVTPSLDGMRDALVAGREVLEAEGSALDAVEAAVRSLELDPHFDAGVGSRLTRAGEVELDASIMDGRTLDGGAVAAITRLRHPISVARRVMDSSEHLLLVGEGADQFADEQQFERCTTLDLIVGEERDRYERIRRGEKQLIREEFSPHGHGGPMGTVGAVARDVAGHLAAATSTGGTQDKRPGRVGDSPILGAGTWADDKLGAASSTGWGEGILRSLMAYRSVDRLEKDDLESAAAAGLATLQRVDGRGGILLLDREGRGTAAFNTPRMARGWLLDDGSIHVAIEADV